MFRLGVSARIVVDSMPEQHPLAVFTAKDKNSPFEMHLISNVSNWDLQNIKSIRIKQICLNTTKFKMANSCWGEFIAPRDFFYSSRCDTHLYKALCVKHNARIPFNDSVAPPMEAF